MYHTKTVTDDEIETELDNMMLNSNRVAVLPQNTCLDKNEN